MLPELPAGCPWEGRQLLRATHGGVGLSKNAGRGGWIVSVERSEAHDRAVDRENGMNIAVQMYTLGNQEVALQNRGREE